MRYTFKDFKAEYPDDTACLKAVLENRYGKTCPKCGVIGVKWHPITGRKAFVCSECDKHVYPLADTIFRKSETSLWNWFYAIFQFSVAKNGISAKELERSIGVTYKTAWRMCKQIRLLMEQDTDILSGEVEADETYIGQKSTSKTRFKTKSAVIGAVERSGNIKAQVVPVANTPIAEAFLKDHVEYGSILYTDESYIYMYTRERYMHLSVTHKKAQYVDGLTHTQTIDGFWSILKRSITGTYYGVSKKYLQQYVNQFTFMYNYRENKSICPILLERASMLS